MKASMPVAQIGSTRRMRRFSRAPGMAPSRRLTPRKRFFLIALFTGSVYPRSFDPRARVALGQLPEGALKDDNKATTTAAVTATTTRARKRAGQTQNKDLFEGGTTYALVCWRHAGRRAHRPPPGTGPRRIRRTTPGSANHGARPGGLPGQRRCRPPSRSACGRRRASSRTGTGRRRGWRPRCG